MSAVKFLEIAEEQGLLEPQVIATLRKQIQAKPNVTAELISKTLVDKGLLTAFQSKKLLTAALEAAQPAPPDIDLSIDVPSLSMEVPSNSIVDLELASPPVEEDDVVMLEAVESAPAPAPSKPKSKPAPAVTGGDDLLDLADLNEVAPPAPTPTGKKPSAPKPSSKPKQPAEKWKQPPPPSRPQSDPAPVDYAPLEPLSPAPLGDLAPLSSPAPLSSSSSGLAPLGGGMDDLLAPLPSSGGLDPFAAPPAKDPLTVGGEKEKSTAKPELKKKLGRTNVWDSPLLLLGGGGLLVMVIAFVVLFYALTRGASSEMFKKADEEYRTANYAGAVAAFNSFIEKYPKDPKISDAKVMRGMAEIRQTSDNAAKDPRTALKTVQTVLPTIEREASFETVRDQLASILPDIADGFAEQAKVTDQMARKIELTKLADESMTLVNNPSYLPSSQRKNLEGRIANILDKLSAARRSIDQDKDLQVALESIGKLVEEGKTADGYQVRNDLVRRFPGLEPHAQLIAATLAISDRERQAVRMTENPIAAATDDSRPVVPRIVLASRQTGSGAAPASQPVFVVVEGAVYGMDLASGKVLWRRYVGHETTIVPTSVSRDPDADVIVGDNRTHELLRLEGATGKVRWRLPIGEAFHQPTPAEDKLMVATAAGKLNEVDLATGNVARQLVLPQKLAVPPVYDAKNARLYQLGEHSTIFVINNSLVCEETYYLGHKAGAIIVPPAISLEHLLVIESPADDYSLLHLIHRDPEKKKLREIDRPLRLRGRVVTPIGVAGRRISVVTDLGEVDVFEMDPAIKERPLQPVGKIEASESVPTLLYQAMDGSAIWLAGHRCTMFEIQVSLQQLGRKWSQFQDDAFLAAPHVYGNTLVHIRRRPNSAAVLVEGCQAGDGKSIWVTQLAAPLIGLAANVERKEFFAINSQARVFEVPGAAVGAGYFDQPSFTPPPGAGSLTLRTARQMADGRWAAFGTGGNSNALFYDPASASDRTKLVDLGATGKELVTPAVQYKQSLVLPLSTGMVALLDPATGKPSALPFQPQLAPGAKVAWNEPAVLSEDRAVVIGDGKQTVYRISVKAGAQPTFGKDAESRVEGDLVSPIATQGDLVYAVVREGAGDSLQPFQAGNLQPGAKLSLGGRYKAGPFAVGDKIFIELQERKLLCIEKERQAWQIDLTRGPLSGRPQLFGNDLLLLHAAGAVARLNLADGKETAFADAGEPLGEVVTIFHNPSQPANDRLLVGGRDGVLHIVTPPQVMP